MSAVSGTGEKPDREMLKFTAATGRNEFPLTEEGSRRRLGASGRFTHSSTQRLPNILKPSLDYRLS